MTAKQTVRSAWFLFFIVAATLLAGSWPAFAAVSLEGNRARYEFKLTVSMARDEQATGVFPVTGVFNVDFGVADEEGGRQVDLALEEVKLPEPLAGAQAGLDKLVGQKLTLKFDHHGRLVDVALPGLPLGELLEEQGQLPYPKTQNLLQSLQFIPAGTTVSVRTSVPGEAGAEPTVFTMDFTYAGLSEDGGDYLLKFSLAGDVGALAARGAGAQGPLGNLPPAEQQAVAQMMRKFALGIKLNGTLKVNAEHGLPSQFDFEALLSSDTTGEGPLSNVGVGFSVTLVDLTPIAQ